MLGGQSAHTQWGSQGVVPSMRPVPKEWLQQGVLLAQQCVNADLQLVSENESQMCHDRDTRSTLYHSVRSRPHIYRPFHCMYLHFPIVSIFLVSLPIGERIVRSVFPYDYLICFHLRSRLLSVPVSLYLLIRYASGNRPQTSLGLLIALHELRWSSACPTPRASPCTFYNSI